MKRRNLIVIVVVLLLLVGGVVAGVRVVLGLHSAASVPPAAASPPPAPPPGFVEFRDPPSGFALAYPAAWTRLPSPDPQVPLLVAQGDQGSFQVRVVGLDTPVAPQDLGALKQLTDQIITNSGGSAKLLAQPQQILLAGLPGYLYLYSFQDAGSGQTGVHSQVFLFKGKMMISLVFQAVPADQFQGLAPTFDQITGSFRVL